ncbi:hypothetical protein HPB51_024403 [Rhipicephalus microplus]|uniref:Uncharacterized protein n=1 Tax=Rhipicephalus microplus TaxID=6941 RepID=A0A9J6DX65_RHIMP|nr:hypothetical protein HPB51_024403 [Rhipicephalus microplus]
MIGWAPYCSEVGTSQDNVIEGNFVLGPPVNKDKLIEHIQLHEMVTVTPTITRSKSDKYTPKDGANPRQREKKKERTGSGSSP